MPIELQIVSFTGPSYKFLVETKENHYPKMICDADGNDVYAQLFLNKFVIFVDWFYRWNGGKHDKIACLMYQSKTLTIVFFKPASIESCFNADGLWTGAMNLNDDDVVITSLTEQK